MRTGGRVACGRLDYVNAFAEPALPLRYRSPGRRIPPAGNSMGDKDKSRKIGDSAKEMSHYAEEQRLGHGRIEFDELGNAIWVPFSGSTSDEVMRREVLLGDES